MCFCEDEELQVEWEVLVHVGDFLVVVVEVKVVLMFSGGVEEWLVLAEWALCVVEDVDLVVVELGN